MLWISILMFVVATIVSLSRRAHAAAHRTDPIDFLEHIGVNYTRIIQAFIVHRNEPGGPAAFFNELSNFTQIFGSTLYIAQTVIGDSVVVRFNNRALQDQLTTIPCCAATQMLPGLGQRVGHRRSICLAPGKHRCVLSAVGITLIVLMTPP